MTGSVLTLNAGSSSLKFALFDAATLAPTMRGTIDAIDLEPYLTMSTSSTERRWAAGSPYDTILHDLLDIVRQQTGCDGLTAIGHRIVHGGRDHIGPAAVTPALLDALDALTPLDPLHLPHNLAPLRVIAAAEPSLPQIVCFDTAFHHTMPAVARAVALSAAITGREIRRYGFHGLSYEYIARHLARASPEIARGRVIVAHLGAGASLCALRGGVSIATTMGFSVLDGLMMATRCGSIDPGVILYLARQGRSIAEIEELLYRQSGLLGVSGISGDMRILLASNTPEARAAIDLFTYRVAAEIGALCSALDGIDALVFTAGIGEHSSAIRSEICARLAWLGVELDDKRNAAGAARVNARGSAIELRVIATDEEAMIAYHTCDIVQADVKTLVTADG